MPILLNLDDTAVLLSTRLFLNSSNKNGFDFIKLRSSIEKFDS